MRVTEQMLVDADALERQGAYNPYRRVAQVHRLSREAWERKHGHPMPENFVHETVATKIEPPEWNKRAPLGMWKWAEWKDVFRPAQPGELEAIMAAGGKPREVGEVQPEEGRPKLIPVRQAPLEAPLRRLLEETTRLSEESAASASCGASSGNTEAKPCSDSDELACQWFLKLPADDATIAQRTKCRPAACPRRIKLEREAMAQRQTEDRMRAARAKMIPEKFRREIIIEGKNDNRPCLSAVRDAHRARVRYIALCANNQEGKTFAACKLLESLPDGAFIEAGVLHEAIKPGAADAPEKEARLKVKRARHVVIDNIDSHITQALRAELDDIAANIGNKDGLLVLTTSMTGAELREALTVPGSKNGALLSRLEMYGRIIDVAER